MRVEDYVGDRITELCKKHKMTKYRLSKLTGISQSTIGYIMKKERIPTLISLEKICDAFNISITQFFVSDKKMDDLSHEQLEILEMWEQLNGEHKKLVKAWFQSIIKGIV